LIKQVSAKIVKEYMVNSCVNGWEYIFFSKKKIPMYKLTQDAMEIITKAIEVVKPERLIKSRIVVQNKMFRIDDLSLDLRKFEKVYVIGFGKASGSMAREIESVVKYGHSAQCQKIRVLEAGHPVIDQKSLSSTKEIMQIAREAGEKDLVICLISGGGSALLEQLPEGISLKDLQKVFKLLLGCGSNIEEINTVRKHLSLVKGGQLARAIAPATCVSIILSDVIGDPLEAIASGPTAPDSTTFLDAWNVIEKYRLKPDLPEFVLKHFEYGLKGNFPETLKPGDPIFNKVYNKILGNNLLALETAQRTAQRLGYNCIILSSRIQGEAREVAQVLASIVQEIQQNGIPLKKPACVLSGGETTVTLKGKGKGGRNQELALAALLAMKNAREDYIIVSCGTDGTDGPTDAAGGMANPVVLKKATKLNLSAQDFLADNNAYPFLERTDGLIITGPTGTNVMDITFALVK
jgi:glycerate-2-kinase